jgi:citrate lyase subunit beta/citryl-CoA lyase
MSLFETVAAARTLLFVPGDRPDRFPKAAASGADLVVVDLEDAVATGAKDAARAATAEWLADQPETVVRINPVGSVWWDGDVDMVRSAGCPVMLPKALADGTAALATALPAGTPLLPLIETAAGVVEAVATCGVPGVARPVLGHLDLAVQLGVDPDDRAALLAARSALVLAAAAAGCAPPVDGVTTALTDVERVAADAAYAASLGFGAKLCVHPVQVAAAAAAFTPTAEQVAWAGEVMAAGGDGVSAREGQMVDAPVLARARALLARARGRVQQ